MLEKQDSAKQVEDFYDWTRNYWMDLARRPDGTDSGMLNFGFWDEATCHMFDAQENLRSLIVGLLGDIPSGARVLEIGGGMGGAAVTFAQEHNDVALTCMDLAPGQLQIAQNRARQAGQNQRIEFRQGSSMDMPFTDETFDFSYCIESSFHYPDKLAFFRENYRVLKPGATAVVADITCVDNLQVKFRSGNYFCDAEDMQRQMKEAGFVVTRFVRIGDKVFNQLKRHIEDFYGGRRDKLCRYWNLVLKNYAELFNNNNMGYDIFVLRKV